MNISKPVFKFLKRNGSLILTIGASAGVIGTSFLTGRAVLKADKLLNEKVIDKKEIVKAYIPPVAAGAATIACIVGCHLMNKKLQAGMLAAYGVLSNTFTAWQSKLTEEEKARVQHSVDNEKVIEELEKLLAERPSEEYSLWIDDFRSKPFWARESDILKGKDELNVQLLNPNFSRSFGYASLSTFYSHVIGDPEPQDELWGWDIDYMLNEWDCGFLEIDWVESKCFDPNTKMMIPCYRIRWWCEPLYNYWTYDPNNSSPF